VPPALPKNKVVAPPATITLDQAIDTALKNNPDTREAWFAARAAEAALGSERSAYFPEVDLNASITRTRNAAQGGRAISRTCNNPKADWCRTRRCDRT